MMSSTVGYGGSCKNSVKFKGFQKKATGKWTNPHGQKKEEDRRLGKNVLEKLPVEFKPVKVT